VNWIAGTPPPAGVRVTAQIRHRHKEAAATITPLEGSRVSLVFDEPQGWFQGANYLGSKLPLVARNSVTSFRRKLNAAEGKH
jgi:hypothetical protein